MSAWERQSATTLKGAGARFQVWLVNGSTKTLYFETRALNLALPIKNITDAILSVHTGFRFTQPEPCPLSPERVSTLKGAGARFQVWLINGSTI